MNKTLWQQIKEAQAIVAKWPKWKRDSVRLEGTDPYAKPREKTCRHCGKPVPCNCY